RHVDAEHTGEGGGREFRRVLETLRSRMLDGTYPLNSLLPPQRELALELDVSRDTVQRVLRELSDEGWVRSRRGSGSKVIKTQRIQGTTPPPAEEPVMTLGRVIGSAFEEDEVTLDVCTLTSESLGIHVRLLLDRIRAGQSTAPRSIDVRLMLPAESVPWPYPVNVADPADDRPRERLREIARRSTATLEESLYELKSENFVTDVRLEIRHAPTVPDFKVYLLNKNRMLYGTYKAIRRKIRLSTGESVDVVDVLGLDAALLYFSGDGGHAVDAYMVDDMQAWFDSRWELLTEEGVTAQGAAAPPACPARARPPPRRRPALPSGAACPGRPCTPGSGPRPAGRPPGPSPGPRSAAPASGPARRAAQARSPPGRGPASSGAARPGRARTRPRRGPPAPRA